MFHTFRNYILYTVKCIFPGRGKGPDTENSIIIDLRLPSEYEKWHIPGSINMDLKSLNAITETGDTGPVSMADCNRENTEIKFNYSGMDHFSLREYLVNNIKGVTIILH